MKTGMQNMIRKGLTQWLAEYPRAEKHGFGLKPNAEVTLISFNEGQVVLNLGVREGIMSLDLDSINVSLTWDELGHHTCFLAACDFQYGTDMTNRFFKR